MAYSEVNQALGPAAEARPNELRSARNWFFVCMAFVLLVIVAVGFANSFYLRGVLHKGATALPGYIILHGIVLTSWFLLFLTQTLLVASGKVRLHRGLGIAGATLAAVLFALSFVVVVRSVIRETSLVVFGDIVILLIFAILITTAVLRRGEPDIHKRFMLAASIFIVAPAIARWPGAQSMLPLSVVVPQLLLFSALVLYDVFTRRRVHSATIWSLVIYVLGSGVTISLAISKFGHTLIEALK